LAKSLAVKALKYKLDALVLLPSHDVVTYFFDL